MANTRQTGLSWRDSERFGSSFSSVRYKDGMMFVMIGGNDDDVESWDGRYDERRIPTARNRGVPYVDKWKDGRYSINSNYKIGDLGLDG